MALKFKSVFSQLQMKIIFGEWPEGCRIPTEMELCEQFGVSRVTIRRALNGLVSQGFIARTRGRGSYVLFRRSVVGLGYPQIMETYTPCTGKGVYRILQKEEREATETDLRQFNILNDNSPKTVWHLKSLHLIDGKPSVLSDYFVSPKYSIHVSSLGETTVDSFLDIVGRNAGQKCHFVNGKVAAINPSEEICSLLEIESQSASLWCRGLCVLDDGTVVGRCTKVFNGLMYEFAVDSQTGISIGRA